MVAGILCFTRLTGLASLIRRDFRINVKSCGPGQAAAKHQPLKSFPRAQHDQSIAHVNRST